MIGRPAVCCSFVCLSCRSPNSTRPTRPTNYEEVSDTPTILTCQDGLKVANFLVTSWRLPRNICYEEVTTNWSQWKLASCTHDVSFSAYLWSPYVIGRPYIFSCCGLFFLLLLLLLLLLFSSPNLSGRRLDVYHTLAHGVALVRI